MAGIILKEHNFHFDVAYTSLLRRSTKTVWIIMQELGLEWVNVIKDWRLNERNYGIFITESLSRACTHSLTHSPAH